METDELKKIKKMYGENFMKMCRSLFSTLCFSKNCKTLYEDIKREPFLEEDFINYIYSKVDGETTENKILTDNTPYELLEEAGYYLTECKTEEEIQKFKKYYKPEEELCTFRGGRLDRCVVFWAI